MLDTLAADPDAFPGRVRAISRDGSIRLYSHPLPPLQITYEVDPDRRVLYLQHFVAPRVPATKPVFISYSHKDAKWLDKLKLFLRPLEEKELISVWDDSSIQPGSDWLSDIRKALESARVAVFLVTQNFISSPFIKNTELPALLDAAKNRGCLIFWIAVSTTTSLDGTPFAKIQGAIPANSPLDLLSEGEQNKALADIYAKLKAAVSVD
ncbi:toll/interleukin-1 receptor domain-containing protein [Microvirga massiliensis]|uniref:toll/interleukin-1 receptor domain-containing protein n=1 Tax=Microvirga massiliensis TaxID=1033741 RepID=UPI00164E8224|nr:toll/interleukin-1 receptor domain-containing protein [Microvirga massiliensis]